jgi:hypothetical protein
MPDPQSLPSNPFATRYMRPGTVPFVFAEGESLNGVISRLENSGHGGAIVGPHGSGKSTLLANVLVALQGAGKRTELFTLRDGQRRLPEGWRIHAFEAALVAIDGYEQLGWLERWRVRRYCRRGGRGLLVTTHAPVGLPTLYCTRPTVALAKQVIRQLLADRSLDHRAMLSDDELAQLFAQHRGDLRELLFALYDRYERLTTRARGPLPPSEVQFGRLQPG